MAFPPGQHVTMEAGKVLGQWARGETIEVPDKALWALARCAANEGMATLKEFSLALPETERVKLKPIREELIATGKRTDKNLAGGVVGEKAAEQASEPTTKPESKPPVTTERISEDAALDIESMLSEKSIDYAVFLNEMDVSSVGMIRADDLSRAINAIEKWT